MKPFVKWVGGKIKIFPEIQSRLPNLYGYHYYEPFVGSGAVFSRIKDASAYYLTDANTDLITTYEVIKNDVDGLIEFLKILKAAHDPEFFKKMRATEPKSYIATAARFIYLNKTCFNGLYRVNKSGKFNVPIGSYKNPGILDAENLRAWNTFLNAQSIFFSNVDFEAGLTQNLFVSPDFGIRTFFYCDPPYDEVFSSYTAEGFSRQDQIRLKETLEKHTRHNPNVKFMVSNSATPFILDLYKDYNIDIIKTTKSVKGGMPQAFDEVIIRNYA